MQPREEKKALKGELKVFHGFPINFLQRWSKCLSHAITFVMAALALLRSSLLGTSREGKTAIGNLVIHVFCAVVADHSQMIISEAV